MQEKNDNVGAAAVVTFTGLALAFGGLCWWANEDTKRRTAEISADLADPYVKVREKTSSGKEVEYFARKSQVE